MEETGIYRIHVVNNKALAVVRADESGIPLAMLDMALGEEWVHDIGKSLRTIRPTINLIILCDDKKTPPAYDDLRPWILVRKPFDMAEFMTAISQPQSAPPTPVVASSNALTAVSNTVIPWLNDATKAAQHLASITLGSSAQAALITRKNDVWAYAGGLSQNAAKEVAQTITRNWDGQKGSDLLRFIRLESTKAEHMLYATRLAADVVLALVFDAETPFSTIRSQASQLVTDLSRETAPAPKPAPSVIPTKNEPEDDFDGGDEDIPKISNILNNVPSPNPEPVSTHNFELPRKKKNFDPNETRVSEALSNATVFNREKSPPVFREHAPSASRNPIPKKNPQPVEHAAELDVTTKSELSLEEVDVTAPSRPKERPQTPVAPPISSTDVTRESPTTEAAKKLIVEPTTAGMYHLTYACLLVPRFSTHYITGDLADHLGEWLPNICVAFGWRLEFLAVRPEYLQWVVNVQPNTSPGYLMRIMRQQTSEKIFADFPKMKRENPSGDFWAPGYLIMGGTQPHPAQLIRDYIRQTRQRQGLDAPPQRG